MSQYWVWLVGLLHPPHIVIGKLYLQRIHGLRDVFYLGCADYWRCYSLVEEPCERNLGRGYTLLLGDLFDPFYNVEILGVEESLSEILVCSVPGRICCLSPFVLAGEEASGQGAPGKNGYTLILA